MSSQPHRNNSDFQLRHFIAGGCHTADGAWNVLYEQKLDIEIKLAFTKARILKREANRLDLEQRKLTISSQADALRYEADMIEFQSGEGLLELAVAGAENELATITELMEEIEPHRRYGHLPLLEATEAAQRDEWREEFKCRIENYLASSGTIPHDQLEVIRKHPDFENDLLPHMKMIVSKIEKSKNSVGALDVLSSNVLLLVNNKKSNKI